MTKALPSLRIVGFSPTVTTAFTYRLWLRAVFPVFACGDALESGFPFMESLQIGVSGCFSSGLFPRSVVQRFQVWHGIGKRH
jgi:hypothetical protein